MPHWYWKIWNINAGCSCAKYDFQLQDIADVRSRCLPEVAKEISKYLNFVASAFTTDNLYVGIYLCEKYKRFWGREMPLSYHDWEHFDIKIQLGNSYADCLYKVTTDNPKLWLTSSAAGYTYRLFQIQVDQEFCDALGAESEVEFCAVEDCNRGRIQYSLMCKKHHFEHIKKRHYPFD